MPQAPFVVLDNSLPHPALHAPHAFPPPRSPGDQWPPPPPPHCGPLDGPDRHLSLRVVSIFVIFAASTLATLLPILASRARARRRSSTSAASTGGNGLLLDFFKHFGSGVIISTAFVHLLSPAFKAFNSPCLERYWHHYPWAEAVAMTAVFSLFFVEVSARRWSSSQSPNTGTRAAHSNGQPAVNLRRSMSPAIIATDLHQPSNGHIATGVCVKAVVLCDDDAPSLSHEPPQDTTLRAQIVGVAILEFGVVFHSIIVGLALATDPKFVVLFGVLTCHQSFEGLGLGARLATLRLEPCHNWIRYAGAVLFGLSTSVGIGLGLALRHIYSPHSSAALIFSGFCDAMSAGILLYTGLVELLAHEFLSNPHLDQISNSRLSFMCASMMLGASLMALLGRWA